MTKCPIRTLLVVLSLVAIVSCGSRATEAQRQSLEWRRGATTGTASSAQPTLASPADAAAAEPASAAASPVGPAPTTLAGGAAPAARADVPRTASDVGITPGAIKLGLVTTLSGPVPGLFQGSAIGLQAFAAYQNSLGGIAGRKLQAVIRDDQFDANQNRNATRELIDETFALVGGVSLYDDASASDVKASGLPDLTSAISEARVLIPNNFSPSPQVPGAALNPIDWLKQRYPKSIGSVASLYGDIAAAKVVHQSYRRAAESMGYRWVYDRGFQATESDFTADAIRMKQAGAKVLWMLAVDGKTIARILKAVRQQGIDFDVIFASASAYDASVLSLAGSAAEGMKLFLPSAMYAGEDAAIVPEVRVMDQWVSKVKPGFKPDGFTALAWAASRLFADAMAKVGPNPKRSDLIAALRTIDKFTANGLYAETGPASKRPALCDIFVEVKGGRYQRIEPARGFRCGPGYFRG